MIYLETEFNGHLVEIRDIQDKNYREELESWRLRVFDSLLTTKCPICNTASKATIVLMSDDGEFHTRFHSYCHQEFVDYLNELVPKYLTSQ